MNHQLPLPCLSPLNIGFKFLNELQVSYHCNKDSGQSVTTEQIDYIYKAFQRQKAWEPWLVLTKNKVFYILRGHLIHSFSWLKKAVNELFCFAEKGQTFLLIWKLKSKRSQNYLEQINLTKRPTRRALQKASSFLADITKNAKSLKIDIPDFPQPAYVSAELKDESGTVRMTPNSR